MNDLIIHPSTLESWELCNYRVLHSNKDGFDHRASEALAFGTGVHRLISDTLVSGQDFWSHGDYEILDVWIEEMQRENHGHPGQDITEYASMDKLLASAAEMKEAWVKWHNQWYIQNDHSIVSVEGTIRTWLGDLVIDPPTGVRRVFVEGTPDLVLETSPGVGRVIDWKTAGKGWKRGKAESRHQHIAYAWLAGGQHDLVIPDAYYVVYDRKNGTWTWDDKHLLITENQIDLLKQNLWAMAQSIDAQSGVAMPSTRGGFGDGRGWHCKPAYCGAWNICDFKGLINDGLAEDTRPSVMRWD